MQCSSLKHDKLKNLSNWGCSLFKVFRFANCHCVENNLGFTERNRQFMLMFIKESGRMINDMEKEQMFFQMMINMKVIGTMI